MTELFAELISLQQEAIDIVSGLSETHSHQQFHSDLSPIAWHLGHCVYTESYWIQEQLLGQTIKDSQLKSLYVPELSKKSIRGAKLPEKNTFIEWAKDKQQQNIKNLNTAINERLKHHLLNNQFLLYFLIQHYSQHIETMHMGMTEIQIKNISHEIEITHPLTAKTPNQQTNTIKDGVYKIGSDNKNHCYDNEYPTQTIELKTFHISSLPVTNAEYLAFINDGAYQQAHYWSTEAWRWCQENHIAHPHHWRQQNGQWLGINHHGPYQLADNRPIYGLSYYEAAAYANWAGARLPHEYEWETAFNQKLLENTALAWEWCSNTFHPYPDFSPYPYATYSAPYFDDAHYVMRGGSCYTKDSIKRASFRNYYTAEKRHIFAGLRLAYD